MKKILLTTALIVGLFVLSLESFAQQRIRYYSPETWDEINVSDDQRTALTELVAKYEPQFDALKSLPKEEAAEQRKKLTGERSREFWKILTPEQTKYLRDKARGGGSAVKSSTSQKPSKTKPIRYYSSETWDEINVSDEQRTALTELVSKYKVQFDAVKADKSLSKEDAKVQNRKLTGERSREFWKILTPEQAKYLKDKSRGN